MTSGQYSFGRRSYRGRIHRMQGGETTEISSRSPEWTLVWEFPEIFAIVETGAVFDNAQISAFVASLQCCFGEEKKPEKTR